MKIVDRLEMPLTEENGFTLKVYRSPKDGKTILAYMPGHGFYSDDKMTVNFVYIPFGVPVKKAFAAAKKYAELYEMEALVIDDPDKLFSTANIK